MNGKRLAFTALLAAGVVAVPGGVTRSTGQTEGAPGLTYGGTKDRYAAWLRFAPGKRAIAAMQMDWAIAPARCSNRKTYSSTMYAGYEEFEPIAVSAAGKFKETVVDNFSKGRDRIAERQEISGELTDDVVSGSISGRVRIEKPNGRVVRCNFGPQRWRLVD
jgi:hypothetical protein